MLIPSNHIDVIDHRTVNGSIDVDEDYDNGDTIRVIRDGEPYFYSSGTKDVIGAAM